MPKPTATISTSSSVRPPARLTYAITHGISIVGDVGYQTVKANIPLGGNLNGPVFLGGFALDGPYLTGQVLAGEQYRSFSVVGNLNYMITPLLTLTASATDNVTTPGANLQDPNALLSGVLAGIASGQIQVPASGILALDQNSLTGIGLESTISRIKTQTVGIQYGLDRLTAVISGVATEQTNVAGTLAGQNSNLQSIGITASLNYALSEDLSAGGDFSYTTQNLAVGSTGGEQFDLHADYVIGEKTRSLWRVHLLQPRLQCKTDGLFRRQRFILLGVHPDWHSPPVLEIAPGGIGYNGHSQSHGSGGRPVLGPFVRAAPGGTFFHLAGWSEIFSAGLGLSPRYLLAERGGVLAGILPLVHQKSLLFGNALIAAPFLVEGGPLAADDEARRRWTRRRRPAPGNRRGASGIPQPQAARARLAGARTTFTPPSSGPISAQTTRTICSPSPASSGPWCARR